jgi:hypothetical protein
VPKWNKYKDKPEYIITNTGYITPCWLWQRAKDTKGYGIRCVPGTGHKNIKEPAHKHYYRKFVGIVPTHLTIDHLCRIKHCVNPEHMEVVTRAENSRRRFTKPINRLEAS